MAGTSQSTLSFTCYWISEPNAPCHAHKPVLRTLFSSCEDLPPASLQISDARQKSAEGIYEDPIQQAVCELVFSGTLSLNQLEAATLAVATQWCLHELENPASSRLLQWLEPDRVRGFWHGFIAQETDLPLQSVAFGTFVGLTTFAEQHSISGFSREARFWLDCTFKHDEKVLHIYVKPRHTCGRAGTVDRLTVKYDDIYRMVISNEAKCTNVYLHVKTLPLIHKQVQHCLEDIVLLKSNMSGQTCELMQFERTLEIGCTCSLRLQSTDLAGCFVVKLCIVDRNKARRGLGRLAQRCKKSAKFVYAPVVTVRIGGDLRRVKQRLITTIGPLLQFPCRYALNALLQRSNDAAAQLALQDEDNLNIFVTCMKMCAGIDEDALEQALFAVCVSIENGSVVTIHAALPALFKKFHGHYTPVQIPDNCCLVRRLVSTPSNLFLLPPEVQCKNRVLRSFDHDYALRVTFRDDNLDYLSHSLMYNREMDNVLETTVASLLRKGVCVAGRHYHYLGSSSSQLRDHGAWLYAKDNEGRTAEDIRSWMGDVCHIPNVGYRMARMGQCFSSTEETVRIPIDGGTKKDLPDIVGGTHPESGRPYIFSDGIGMISESLLEKACEGLGLAELPSAVQIRYAGYKGMLCLNPDLSGDQLLLRPSMNKFNCSTSDTLEIVQVSAPCPVFLNRPLITILEQLGVPGRVFLRLQQRMVLQLCDAFVSDEAALSVLGARLNMHQLPLARLHHQGLSLVGEPFMRSLLLAIYNSTVAGLRSKGQIAVPEDRGRNMLGVLDETGTLEYGQVFVQFSEINRDRQTMSRKRATRIITGTVLVTKCPCLHPGDVRKFEAVDVPALHHIKDCVVFPAKGPRPHPNEMAGSDLDGDEYVVIADRDLLFPGDNHEPMVFSDHVVEGKSSQNLAEDMASFTCNYIKNDTIGVMSNAHLVWADQLPDGIFSHKCLALARKISVALDFAKTGVSAGLDRSEQVHRYPEFMEKTCNKNTYRSTRVLGQLYRLNKGLTGLDCNGCTKSASYSRLLELSGWQEHRGVAERAKILYADLMNQILSRYDIASEAEVVVVTGLPGNLLPSKKGRNHRRNVAANVQKQYQNLVEIMRERFFADAEAALSDKSLSEAESMPVLLRMASAWYMVGRDARVEATNCHGFPWCVADVLLMVLKSSGKDKRNESSRLPNPLLRGLNDAIAKCFASTPAASVAFKVLLQWAAKEGVLSPPDITPHPGICRDCLFLLFSNFASLGTIAMLSSPTGNENRDVPGSLFGWPPRSAAAYVVEFLRHLANAPVWGLLCQRCRQQSSQAHVVPLTALRCYSHLVVSGSPCHLGLPCNRHCRELDQKLQERDPIRLQVKDAGFLHLLREGVGCVEELLRRWSGAQAVRIRYRASRSGSHHYALVSARGRDWQLWFLEELLLQPWFEQAVVRGSVERHL